jgi:outer membrane protein, heavy metal efflux system
MGYAGGFARFERSGALSRGLLNNRIMLYHNRTRPAELHRRILPVVIPVVAIILAARPAGAQANSLDALIARADSASPVLQAARYRVTAASARVGPAAAWADPMLMAGIQNLPLGSENVAGAGGHGSAASTIPGDPMTMKMIGVSQTIPYPGKLRLRRQAAEREVDAARANLDATGLATAGDVRTAFFELAYIDRALTIVERNRSVLADLIQVTEAHYASGTGGQQDVLKARVEAARLGGTASALLEERRAISAELNAILNRDDTTSVPSAAIPERIVQAAIPSDPNRIRFAAQTLGARTVDSPFPPLAELQDLAVRQNPTLRENEADLAGQTARVDLARKGSRPDFDVSLQYGQRNQRPDMITAEISVPLPIHKRARQDQELAEARAELSAMESDRRAKINSVRAQVARLVSELERGRTQLAIYVKAILPQGNAAATAALASYQSGKTDLLTVLDNQNTVFTYETEYYRSLSDFAKNLAELEQVVGSEVLR